jgi:hypothetical protein
VNEIRLRDGDLAKRVGPTFIEIAGSDVSSIDKRPTE